MCKLGGVSALLVLLLLLGREEAMVVDAWIPAALPVRRHQQRQQSSRLVSSARLQSSSSTSSSWNEVDDENETSSFSSSSPSSNPSWSVTDDWTALSQTEQRHVQGHDIFQQDLLWRAARRLEFGQAYNRRDDDDGDDAASPDDAWLQESIQKILNPRHEEDDDEDGDEKGDADEDHKKVTSQEYTASAHVADQEEKEGHQVALLVRCQQVPQDLLIAEGRAVADLTWAQAHDVRQLVQWNQERGWWEATDFLREAASQLFEQHVVVAAIANGSRSGKDNNDKTGDDEPLWDASAVASWMRQSLREACGRHDKRVATVLSTFGSKGFLARQGLRDLYVQALVGNPPRRQRRAQGDGAAAPLVQYSNHQVELELTRFMERRVDAIKAVWRDLQRHGIQSPAQTAHREEIAQLEIQQEEAPGMAADASFTNTNMMIMDECEVVYDAQPDGWFKDAKGQWQLHGKSSHEKVLLANDHKTPLLLQDGDYVYIDEESCIGCTQCALAAPASFRMLDNGRARTFLQRGRIPDVEAAVKTCPVNCMHYVSFDRLKTLEVARDSHDGDDGRDDHRHFGRDRRNNKWRAHTPLYVSRMESSDANHKDSLYHYTRRQCYQSGECPKRGCYDCPLYASNPEANPHLQKRRHESIHARAQTFETNGEADFYRKTADI